MTIIVPTFQPKKVNKQPKHYLDDSSRMSQAHFLPLVKQKNGIVTSFLPEMTSMHREIKYLWCQR